MNAAIKSEKVFYVPACIAFYFIGIGFYAWPYSNNRTPSFAVPGYEACFAVGSLLLAYYVVNAASKNSLLLKKASLIIALGLGLFVAINIIGFIIGSVIALSHI